MSQRFRQFQVDAFTARAFAGNPAAVVLVDEWPPDDVLQDIAIENAYSETAYLLEALEKDQADYHLRWF
ncbi:MAG: PhzF family phenazine biosynthesis protein, partial [Ottowia sp.]|nr:PhzF family phenazine biosynthesis protein [Ottowia sp.]